jgi:hypothetical protein
MYIQANSLVGAISDCSVVVIFIAYTVLGTTLAPPGTSCCNAGVEQLISITDTGALPGANLKEGATLSTIGIYHYPAKITNAKTTKEIAAFGPGGPFTTATTAAVIQTLEKREQMVWFMSFATNWSLTSNFLQHAWIAWITRGLYTGFRRVYFSTQVDDMFLKTPIYHPSGKDFRVSVDDVKAHIPWTRQINAKMPAGSEYFIEIGHNGNGDIEVSFTADYCP